MAELTTSTEPKRGERYLTNVLWNWFGAGVNLLVGFFLSPYIIRKLGTEGFGLWALLFSLFGYFALVDLGLGSAVIRYTAYHRAQSEHERINQVVNTALASASIIAVFPLAFTVYLSRSFDRFFQVSPSYRHEFSLLILMTGVILSLGTVFNVFGWCLEGFQRFDRLNRIWMVTNVVRGGGCALLLALGQGLFAMGVITVVSQILGHSLRFLSLRQTFPALRLAFASTRISTLKEIAQYGVHAFLANLGSVLLSYAPPVLVGHFFPVDFVGYYSIPTRLLQYTSDIVERTGQVTTPSAAELSAEREREPLYRLGVYSNRYSLVLFMPLTIVLFVYGPELLRAWVGAFVASYSAPILPVLLCGTAIAVVGQFNSNAILFGMGKHQRYAYGLLVESVLAVVGMIVVIPRFGILGAAWIVAVLMILIRGLYTPWLVCRNLHFDFITYLRSIFLRPFATALPVALLAYECKIYVLPGSNWPQLISILAAVSILYFAAAFFTCLEPKHEKMILEWVEKHWCMLTGLARKS